MSEYFVGMVNIAFNCYNNRFVLHIINHRKMLRLRVLTHPGLHHTLSGVGQFVTIWVWANVDVGTSTYNVIRSGLHSNLQY